jgi:hypothetical protein
MSAGTKNTRNAALLICATLGGTYVKVNKTHGLSIGVPTDWSEDTGHGQRFKTKLPGLQDFTLTLSRWYTAVESTLEAASVNKIPYYFQVYEDFADPLNYYRGRLYFGLNEENLDIGNTADQSYDVVLADEDLDIIRNGTSIIVD